MTKVKKKNKLKITLITMVLLIILCFVGISCYMGMQVFDGSTQLVTNEETFGFSDSFFKNYSMDYEDFCKKYNIENLEIKSTFDGHMIPADYIYSDKSKKNKNNKTVILVHGLGGNRYSTYPVAEMFLDAGYNVLAYDQRSTNENTAQYTTFGYWEKFDLIDYIDYVRADAPERELGIWGTSFGGATVGLAMGHDDTDGKVDFLIFDCPVSNMEWMVSNEMKDMDVGIPVSYMTWCGNIINKLKLGFTYGDADVSKSVSKINTQALIINSKADTVTPYFMGQDIYEAIPGQNKSIWTVPDSEHTEMWLDHNSEYREQVLKLIHK